MARPQPISKFLALAMAVALVAGLANCQSSGHPLPPPDDPEQPLPDWVLQPPNEPGVAIFASALDSNGASFEKVRGTATRNLADKTYNLAIAAWWKTDSRLLSGLHDAIEKFCESAGVIDRYERLTPDLPATRAVLVRIETKRLLKFLALEYEPVAQRGETFASALRAEQQNIGFIPYRPTTPAPTSKPSAEPPPAVNAQPSGEPEAPGESSPQSEREIGPEIEPVAPRESSDLVPGEAPANSSPAVEPPSAANGVESVAQGPLVVVIGVSECRVPGIDANKFAAPDARTMAAILRSQEIFPTDERPTVKLFVGADATSSAIGEWLRANLPGARALVLYYSGRAVWDANPPDLRLLTPDSTAENHAGLRVGEWSALIAAARVPALMILDGVAAPVPTSQWNVRVPVMFAASAGEIPAANDAAYHNLFTYFLIRGIRGPASGDDSTTTVGELFGYVSGEVSTASAGKQTPFIAGPDSRLGFAAAR